MDYFTTGASVVDNECFRGRQELDAVVIGSGPNGLAAAIVLAEAGCRVVVFEGARTIGGGARSVELTLPGFVHDVCSAVHPLAVASPFFRRLPLRHHGLEWIFPPAALAHPFDDGTAVLLEGSPETTAANLGEDGDAYRKLVGPLLKNWEGLLADILAPPHMPMHPILLARFAIRGMQSAESLARSRFRGPRARALFAGLAAHSMLALNRRGTAAFALILAAAAHGEGWPFPRGGAQKISDSLAHYLQSLGGEVVTGTQVESLETLPPARVVLCDMTPRQLVSLAGDKFSRGFRRRLNKFRYGPGAFKVDWALAGPIPWIAPECARAGTVHLGGSMEEIAAAEREVWAGRQPERPFVLLSQPSLFDPTRAPVGRHTVWAYCHVPNASEFDMLAAIEAQVERFAPGFRRRILTRFVTPPAALERYNPNLIGGDINGGLMNLRQLVTRPTRRLYRTPLRDLFLCSASTPPGGGVHGMCGYFAAQCALKYLQRK
jgi:phytoene dehydrogenase-like protein